MNVHTEPPEAPRGLVRAVTRVPTLGTGAVHGDFSTYNLGKITPHGLGELVYSFLKGWYASLIAYRVRTTHSKIVNTCIVQSIHVLTYVARHLIMKNRSFCHCGHAPVHFSL